MESWEIKHFLFSRDDDPCIYLHTKNTSRNGNLVNENRCLANLYFVDGKLPENIVENNKWQVHYPVSMYKWVVDLLMTNNPVFIYCDKFKKRFLLSSIDESITEEVSHST